MQCSAIRLIFTLFLILSGSGNLLAEKIPVKVTSVSESRSIRLINDEWRYNEKSKGLSVGEFALGILTFGLSTILSDDTNDNVTRLGIDYYFPLAVNAYSNLKVNKIIGDNNKSLPFKSSSNATEKAWKVVKNRPQFINIKLTLLPRNIARLKSIEGTIDVRKGKVSKIPIALKNGTEATTTELKDYGISVTVYPFDTAPDLFDNPRLRVEVTGLADNYVGASVIGKTGKVIRVRKNHVTRPPASATSLQHTFVFWDSLKSTDDVKTLRIEAFKTRDVVKADFKINNVPLP